MKIRPAAITDIPRIMKIRFSVRENILSDPAKVTAEDCRAMIEEKGRGWVCEMDGKIVGFSIVDLSIKNVWALFLLPEYEGRGIGKMLLQKLEEWAREQGINQLWLSTDPGTRAEGFYEKMGWQRTGLTENGEVRFQMNLIL